MLINLEDFKTGWFGIQIALNNDEIDQLIDLLKFIQNNQSEHFHLSSKFLEDEKSGVADIEFSVMGSDEMDNAQIG